MIDLFLWIGVFIISLFVLVRSSDFFTNSAERIGIFFGIPSFVVGVTIVAIGTSLPEIISSIFAVLNNSSEIVPGNVLGSNIANIFLILGVVAIFARKIETKYDLLKVDLPIFFASALYLYITFVDGIFTFSEGLFGVLGIIIYIAFTATTSYKSGVQSKEVKSEKKSLKKEGIFKQVIVLIISGFFIFLSAKYTIDSVIQLSDIFSIGKEIIALSAVAIGTSLPELLVGVQAARRGNAGMAFGNVLGSNIFNALGVMGISSIFGTIVIPASLISFTLPIMIGASILFFFMLQDRQLTIWEGAILLLAYILYLGKIFSIF